MLDRLRRRETVTATELPPGTPRILLIDDDPDEVEMVRDLLERAGAYYQVELAGSYAAGLERLAEGNFEAALVDYRLGEWSGLDVLRKAQEMGWGVPLVLLTGDRDPSVDQMASGFGAVDFLRKGKITPEDLERSIRFAAAQGRALGNARDAEARMAALGEIGRILADHGPSADALDRVAALLSETFRRGYLSIYLVDGEPFRLAAQRGHALAIEQLERSGPLVNALRTRRPSFVPNQSAEPQDRTSADPQIELCLPLTSEGELFGLLLVGQDDNRPIGESEHAALVSVTTRIAGALALAKDRREVAARAVRSRRTSVFVAKLAAAPDRDALLGTLAEACAVALDVTRVIVRRANGEQTTVVSSYGPDPVPRGTAGPAEGVDKSALAEGRPNSVARRLAGADGALGDWWEAGLPIVRADKVVGVLHVERAGQPFDVYEREAAVFVAGLLAVILGD